VGIAIPLFLDPIRLKFVQQLNKEIATTTTYENSQIKGKVSMSKQFKNLIKTKTV
jgi:hypothetical protein